MLDDILTDDELSQSVRDPKLQPQQHKSSLVQVVQGVAGGAADGALQPGMALLRPVLGDKIIDSAINTAEDVYKPDDLTAVGEFTYSISSMLSSIAATNLLTLGAGNTLTTAGAFGVASASREKAALAKKGVTGNDAWVAAGIKGATDTASVALPVSGITRTSLALDAALSVGTSVGVGSAGQYLEGSYIANHGNKQYGEQLKDDAFSLPNLATNGGIGMLLWAWGARTRASQANLPKLDDVTNAAHIDANREFTSDLNPLNPANAVDRNSHLSNLDAALEAAKNDKPVAVVAPVSGLPKVSTVALTGIPEKISQQAKGYGFRDDQIPYVLGIGDFESSGFKPGAKNPASSAHGIFQVIDSTWKKNGGGDRNSVDEQIRVGLTNLKKSVESVEKSIGRPLTGSEIYLPHLLGEGGARIALKADPSESFFQVAKRMYSKAKNPEATARKMMKDNGIKAGATTGEVLQHFKGKIEGRATKFGGMVSEHVPLLGSKSDFPQFESPDVEIPAYKNKADLQASVMPDVVRTTDDPILQQAMSDDFDLIQAPLTQVDLDILRLTQHYQPADLSSNAIEYVEPLPTLQGRGQSAARALNELDEVTPLPAQQTAVDSEPVLTPTQSAPDAPQRVFNGEGGQSINVDQWTPTRAANYLKRETVAESGARTQALHNTTNNVTFTREVQPDGTVSRISASRGGQDLFKRAANDSTSPELTTLQDKAAQALEKEFYQPRPADPETPKLGGGGEYGVFDQTPDGREAVRVMEEQPDLEITFTPVDENGNELEPVTLTARDMLDYIREQEELAKDEVTAVKALASCAIQFGEVA